MLTIDKRQAWQKILDRAFRIKRINSLDAGIESIVMRLNASGVCTTQSCEGHLDHGLPYPWVRIVEQDCALLESLLETFYEHRSAVYDRMLSIEHILTDEYMLRSHGGILQKSRDLDERAEKIKEYQQEMQSFAEFLKEQF